MPLAIPWVRQVLEYSALTAEPAVVVVKEEACT
jgi:hypothetical protein